MSIFRPISVVCIVPFLYLVPTTVDAEVTATDALSISTNQEVTQNSMPTATLPPITITARGVEEDQLETPFVVKTINSTTLDEQHIKTVEQAVRSEPSMDLHNGGHVEYSTLRMRGTGSLSITGLDDGSVDVRVDGIGNGKAGLARNLIDVDSIEIAKGPQGTIHGTSAEAGSVSIKTNNPVDWFEGHVGAGVGNQNHKSLEAVLNVPLSDSIALRVAGVTNKTDNYLDTKEEGKPLNIKNKQGVQAKLLWQNQDNEVVIGAYHDIQTNDVPLLQLDFDSNQVATFGLKHESDSISQGISLNTKSDLDFAQLETHTGYNLYKGEISRPALPPEMLPLYYAPLKVPPPLQQVLNPIFAQNKNNRQFVSEDSKQVSTELRLVSQPDNDIKWVTGVYLENKERDWHNDGKISLDKLPANNPIKAYLTTTAGNGDTYKNYDRQTQAIFGEITYPVTDALDVIAGARYTHEKQKHRIRWSGNSNNILGTVTKSAGKTLDEDALTGRLGLSYAVIPNWRLYGLYSRGNKFGGFSDYDTNVAYGNDVAYFEPTTIDAVEVGSKFQSEDKRLNLGIALYQNRMTDDHVLIYGVQPTYNTTLANVDTQSTGAEVSASWQVTDNLKLNTDLSYTDTEVTDASDILNARLTKEGNQMPLVPEFSGSVAVRYSDELQGVPVLKNAEWYVGADYRYVGKRFAEANNLWELDSYGLLGVNMGIISDKHELGIWGKNLTDEKYLNFGIAQGPFNVGTNGEGRTYGLKYSHFF